MNRIKLCFGALVWSIILIGSIYLISYLIHFRMNEWTTLPMLTCTIIFGVFVNTVWFISTLFWIK